MCYAYKIMQRNIQSTACTVQFVLYFYKIIPTRLVKQRSQNKKLIVVISEVSRAKTTTSRAKTTKRSTQDGRKNRDREARSSGGPREFRPSGRVLSKQKAVGSARVLRESDTKHHCKHARNIYLPGVIHNKKGISRVTWARCPLPTFAKFSFFL